MLCNNMTVCSVLRLPIVPCVLWRGRSGGGGQMWRRNWAYFSGDLCGKAIKRNRKWGTNVPHFLVPLMCRKWVRNGKPFRTQPTKLRMRVQTLLAWAHILASVAARCLGYVVARWCRARPIRAFRRWCAQYSAVSNTNGPMGPLNTVRGRFASGASVSLSSISNDAIRW